MASKRGGWEEGKTSQATDDGMPWACYARLIISCKMLYLYQTHRNNFMKHIMFIVIFCLCLCVIWFWLGEVEAWSFIRSPLRCKCRKGHGLCPGVVVLTRVTGWVLQLSTEYSIWCCPSCPGCFLVALLVWFDLNHHVAQGPTPRTTPALIWQATVHDTFGSPTGRMDSRNLADVLHVFGFGSSCFWQVPFMGCQFMSVKVTACVQQVSGERLGRMSKCFLYLVATTFGLGMASHGRSVWTLIWIRPIYSDTHLCPNHSNATVSRPQFWRKHGAGASPLNHPRLDRWLRLGKEAPRPRPAAE